MPVLEFKNYDLYYEEYGDGPPLVLIAGLASDSQSWLPVVDSLAKYFRVITFDNKGVGRSSQDNSSITISEMADNCVDLIQHLKLEFVHLLGHSMGGMIAMDLSIRYPEIVNKLILAATNVRNSERNKYLFSDWARNFEQGQDLSVWFRNLFYWILTSHFFEDKKAVETAIQFSIDYPYPQSSLALQNQVKAINDFDCLNMLSKIKAETLVVAGEEDMLYPVKLCSELASLIPGSKLSIIKNAAHSIHMETPKEFADIVINFLKA